MTLPKKEERDQVFLVGGLTRRETKLFFILAELFKGRTFTSQLGLNYRIVGKKRKELYMFYDNSLKAVETKISLSDFMRRCMKISYRYIDNFVENNDKTTESD